MKDSAETHEMVKEILKWAKYITEKGGGDIRIAKCYPVNPQEIDKPPYYGTME